MDEPTVAEQIAIAFHEAYERLAPHYNYETRRASAVPWPDVPESNRALMTAVVGDLLHRGTIASATKVDDLQVALIEARNPGIDVDDVRRIRAARSPAGREDQ